MFSDEVQKILDRNATLVAENSHLYQTVNELMTELTALKAANSKFKEDCQNFVESQTNNLLTPSRELSHKLYRQSREIEALKEQLFASESKAHNSVSEKERLEEEKNMLESRTKESEKITIENKHICRDVLRSVIRLQKAMKDQKRAEDLMVSGDADDEEEESNHNSTIDDAKAAQLSFSQQLREIQMRFSSINDQYSRTLDKNQGFMLEVQAKDHAIRDLETRMSVLQKQMDATNEANQRYTEERAELQGSIDTLRGALTRMKEQYIKADKERKELLQANLMLKDAIKSTKITLEDSETN